jgi:Prophage protein (DUF1660)
MTKDELEKAKGQLFAEELATKKKWCVLLGHKWDLPAVNPFNNNVTECEIICGRCNAHGIVSVTV